MALSETTWDSESASQAVGKRYSRGSGHSAQIRKALQAKRLAGKHVRTAIDQLAAMMHCDDPRTVVAAATAMLDRALGKAASAPEDHAAALAIAQSAPADFLLQLLNMRQAAMQRQAIDMTVAPTTEPTQQAIAAPQDDTPSS